MRLAAFLSRSTLAVDAPQVRVEVHIAEGLPKVTIVGLAETAVKESRERVRAAIVNSGFEFPSAKRVTVNLAPADLPKEGGRYDLPIAVGILAAFGKIQVAEGSVPELAGELSLDGALHSVRGALPMALAACKAGRSVILPAVNADEGALVERAAVFGALTLNDVCAHLTGAQALPRWPVPVAPRPRRQAPDLADVRGQQHARRALEIAAAGGHSLLLVGPPGTGKTMLAERLVGILPELDDDEALECAALASLSGYSDVLGNWRRRPFRAPHHTVSAAALAGGGRQPRPGELSLAHNGVLFLDELPEFDRRSLEVLRQPLESGSVAVARVAGRALFPARVQLVAAMNPCPCGYHGDPEHDCHCSEQRVASYRHKISGPLLDRIDMHLVVPRPRINVLAPDQPAEASRRVASRVALARQRQARRGGLNARITASVLTGAILDPARRLLEEATERLRLSARAQHKVLRLARTVADLGHASDIGAGHIAEAIGLRCPGADASS